MPLGKEHPQPLVEHFDAQAAYGFRTGTDVGACLLQSVAGEIIQVAERREGFTQDAGLVLKPLHGNSRDELHVQEPRGLSPHLARFPFRFAQAERQRDLDLGQPPTRGPPPRRVEDQRQDGEDHNRGRPHAPAQT